MCKRKTIQKLTAMMLSVIMVVGMMPISALAETGSFPIGVRGEVTSFEALGLDVAVQNVPLGTSEADLELPDSLTATVRLATSEEEPILDSGEMGAELDSAGMVSGSAILLDVTWTSSPEYDGEAADTYVFTPKLSEGLTLTSGVEVPKITVTVTKDASTALDTKGISTLFSDGSGEPWELEGAGFEGDPLRIETAEQLAAFAWHLNNNTLPDTLPDKPYFRLENDISLSAYGEDYDGGKGWTPIGGYNIDKKEFYSFNGTFDGNGKTIRDLYIHHDSRGCVGLFGYIKEGTVKNLTVEGGNVTGYSGTGSIVGDLIKGRVESCVFSGSVTGTNDTGGIVGRLHASQLKNCVNNGRVTGKVATGGIGGSAGSADKGNTIENCVNTGEVTGSEELTGGIVGLLMDMIVDRCVNAGAVQGGTRMNTGGVAAFVFDGIIQNCVNSGGVSSKANNVGGVAGSVRMGTIHNCVNYADISSNANSAGGVAGFVEGSAEGGSTVTNCLTTGSISGKATVIEPGGVSGVAGVLHSANGYKNNISGCVALGQSVTNGGEMGGVSRIAFIRQGDIAFDNFAWSGMPLWWHGNLIPEEDYASDSDGENADAATLQTLWTAGALAESWSDAGVWTLAEGKLPVLTGLPHQSDKFPSHISGITGMSVSPSSTSVQKGTTQSFTATVTGIDAFDNAVIWRVSDGTDGTTINPSGVLTVAADETADTLTVTAISNVDISKKNTASVRVTDEIVIKYALTVNSGSGTGEYAEGTNLTLTANPPAAGKQFKNWTASSGGSFTSASSVTTTFTMPANAVTVTANYEDIPATPHPVVVEGSYASTTGAGSYTKDATVNIYAGNRSNYSFSGWTVLSGGVTITNASSKNASFTMPDNAVTVKANWNYDGGGSSGGGSSSGRGTSTPTVTTPPATTENPKPATEVTMTVKPTVSNGTVTVTVSDTTVNDAIAKAQAEAKKNGTTENGIVVEIQVDSKNTTAKNFTANLTKASVDAFVKAGIKEVRITSEIIHINLNLDTLKEIQKQALADVNVTAKKVDNRTLSAEVKKLAGDRPVYDLSITGTNGKRITDFGKGKVSVSIPYTLGANENPANVVAYYIDGNGKVNEMPNSVYDPVTKTVSFVTDHFSQFAVGYKTISIVFTDITNHWAKESIEFVAARGLLAGTGNNKFSPNASMTRGMFVTALGRLAEADVSKYTKSSFTDVKADAYYMGYVEWANKNGIVNGISTATFAPDSAITREQMAVIMENYAKAIGFELPKVHAENIFADNAEISTYAKDAVKSMQMAGVLAGKNGNKFDPQGTATRAEVSAVLKSL